MKLRAKSRFHINGSEFMEIGEEFTTNKSTAEELISLGLAEKLDAKVDYTEEMAEEMHLEDAEAAPQVRYDEMTVSQLRDVAKAHGIEGYSRKNKSELVDAIIMKERGDF